MAIYLGSQKYKIHFAHNLFKTNLAASIIATFIPKNVLISSDNYLLKDMNNVYLTVKEGE